jgi:hypothetical protein
MQVHKFGTPALIGELGAGTCFACHIDHVMRIALKVSWNLPGKSVGACLILSPGLDDYKGCPGIVEESIVARSAVFEIRDAIFIPRLDSLCEFVENLPTKLGLFVVSGESQLMVAGDNRKPALIDLEGGANYQGQLDYKTKYFSSWSIFIRGRERHLQELCHFTMPNSN